MAPNLTKKIPSIQSINFDLLKAKLFYFFFTSGLTSLLPYLYLYYKHVLFLSPVQVTVLLAVRPLCLIVGAPLLGTYADKTNRFKATIVVCLIGYILTYGSITLLEPVEGFNCGEALSARAAELENLTEISNRSKEYKFLRALRDSKYEFFPGRVIEDSLYSWPFRADEYEETEQITKKLFTTVLVIMIIGELISSPANTFADVYTLQTLGESTYYYGYQLVPGVIGTGIVSTILLLLTRGKKGDPNSVCDKSLILSEKTYFIQFLIFMALALAIAVFFKYHKNRQLNRDKVSRVSYFCGGCKLVEAIRIIFRNASHASFMLIVFVCAVADGAKTAFIYTFITELGNGKDKHISPLVTATHFLSHVVFLALSPFLLRKYGHTKIIGAGILTYALCFLVYGMVNDPVWLFLVEPFDGVARQLTRVAVITFVGSPPGIGAALQGLTHAIYLGVGTSVGTFICGYLAHLYGYVLIFLIMGAMCILGFGFWLAADHFWHGDKTIAETFTEYSLAETSDNESDFEFLLTDISNMNRKADTPPLNEEENGNVNELK